MDCYKVTYPAAVEKDLAKLPDAEIRQRIFAKIGALQYGLQAVPGCRKLVKFKSGNFYRFRQGNFRVVFAVNKKSHEIRLIAVGPRATVYKTIVMRA